MALGVLGELCVLLMSMKIYDDLWSTQDKLNAALVHWNDYNGKTGQLLLSSRSYDELLSEWLTSVEYLEDSLSLLGAPVPIDALDPSLRQSAGKLGWLWSRSLQKVRIIENALIEVDRMFGETLSSVGGLLFNLGKVSSTVPDAGFNPILIFRSNARDLLAMNEEFYLLLNTIASRYSAMLKNRISNTLVITAAVSIAIISITLLFGFYVSREITRANLFLENQIREKNAVQIQLERAKEEAEAADRAKTQFLANISHELRTPLNSIIGYAELNLMPRPGGESGDYSPLIIKESEKLLYLVNDLLDFSKLEFDKLKLERIPFSLPEMLRDSTDTLRLRAERKGLVLSIMIESDVPVRLVGDPYRLRQVIVNLLDNAVKFTESGMVALHVIRLENDTESLLLRFDIEDTGIGIPIELQGQIFDSFTQADGSMSRRYGGTGLGTSIAKRLVTLMGGDITLESEPDVGSRFSFTARFGIAPADTAALPSDSHDPGEPPRTEPAGPAPRAVSRAARSAQTLSAGRRARAAEPVGISGPAARSEKPAILLVEDYQPNADVAIRFLLQGGYSVDHAPDGTAAVEMTAAKRYALILMDIQMPGLDGYRTAEIIRSGSDWNRTVPILALTANAFASDREKTFAAGMNELVPKPVRREPLLAAVSAWIARGTSDTTGSRAGTSTGLQPGTASGEPDAAGTPAPGRAPDTDEPIRLDSFFAEIQDAAAARELLLGYLDEVRARLPILEHCLSVGDTSALHREAHSIKGGALNIMAPGLELTARELERCAKSDRHDELSFALAALRREFSRLVKYLEDRGFETGGAAGVATRTSDTGRSET
jgi:signal transduction histidine kinase/CheY-like chemotaxis protein/HPt (histidine-containing phosphotransfer) domain-containing protein